MGGSRHNMPLKTFTVTQAVYYDENDVQRKIAGVPEYGSDSFGQYTGYYPYEAASKAFSGLQRHMKMFHKQRMPTWFPAYDPESPPVMIFIIRDIDSERRYAYQGQREFAPQSVDAPRVVTGPDGRVRAYNWINNIKPLKLADVLEPSKN